MRNENVLAAIELAMGLAMLVGFVGLLLVPAVFRLVTELLWAIGVPQVPPGFGINPHRLAGAPYAPSLALLTAGAALAVSYRWLLSRRRG